MSEAFFFGIPASVSRNASSSSHVLKAPPAVRRSSSSSVEPTLAAATAQL